MEPAYGLKVRVMDKKILSGDRKRELAGYGNFVSSNHSSHGKRVWNKGIIDNRMDSLFWVAGLDDSWKGQVTTHAYELVISNIQRMRDKWV